MATIVFKDKHGDRVFQSEHRHTIFNKVLQERIEDGFWYEGDEAVEAEHALADGKSESFLAGRRDYEYEGYDDLYIEQV